MVAFFRLRADLSASFAADAHTVTNSFKKAEDGQTKQTIQLLSRGLLVFEGPFTLCSLL